MPVICVSDETQVTNFSYDQHVWPLYLMIGNILNDIRQTSEKCSWIHVALTAGPLRGDKNIDEALHSAVRTVLSQQRHVEIAGPGLKWDCADVFL